MLNSNLPKITMVTPNYNYGRFLGAAIESVVGQGYPNLEYIVLDDGSTDDSVETIRRYESKLSTGRLAKTVGNIARLRVVSSGRPARYLAG
jgi:glycosyltransferase involved in cell wall biosynthesis